MADHDCPRFKFQFIDQLKNGRVTFLCPHKKVTKESGIGEALRTNAPSPMYPSRRTAGSIDRIVTYNT